MLEMKVIGKNHFSVEDTKTKYLLTYTNSINYLRSISIFAEIPRCRPNRFPVTARNIDDYDTAAIKEQLPLDCQYLEVGVGLSEQITKLQYLNKKPIAIDPVNYELIAELLHFCEGKINQSHENERKELLRRVETILGPDIYLVNKTLGEALEMPELIGVADIVVDVFGPSVWDRLEDSYSFDFIVDRMKRFLKPNGTIYLG